MDKSRAEIQTTAGYTKLDSKDAERICEESQITLKDHGEMFLGRQPPLNPLGDLDNMIHKVFDRVNWLRSETSTKFFETIHLALRLASFFITEPRMLDFFSHVALGDLKMDDVYKIPYLHANSTSLNEHGRKYVKAVFEAMGSSVFFTFSDNLPDGEAGCCEWYAATSHSISHSSTDKSADSRDGQCKKGAVGTIHHGQAVFQIHCSILRYFECHFANDTAANKLTNLFELACLLVHELTHAFFRFTRGGDIPEPRISAESNLAELGWAWQIWATGHPLRIPKDLDVPPLARSHRCFKYRIESFTNIAPVTLKMDTEAFILPTVWTRAWFRKATWGSIAKEGHGFLVRESKRLKLVRKTCEQIKGVCVSSVELDGEVLEVLYAHVKAAIPHRYVSVCEGDIAEAFGSTLQNRK